MPTSYYAPQQHHPDYKTFICVRCYSQEVDTIEVNKTSEVTVLTITEKDNPVLGYLDRVGCYEDLDDVKALAIGESLRLGFHQGSYNGVIVTRIH